MAAPFSDGDRNDLSHWREIAFSHRQIVDFLSIVALPHFEAEKLLPFGSALHHCFCTRFYFFCGSIQEELVPAMAEDLLNLAVRVEAQAKEQRPSQAVWDQNAEEARRLFAHYFGGGGNEATFP